MQAITAATGENAKLLHVLDRGTIAVGKRADLLVLDADPLIDIRNTQRIFAVYHDGRVLGICRVDEGNGRLRFRIKKDR